MNEQQEHAMLLSTDPDYGKGDKPIVGIIGHGRMGTAVERSLVPHVDRFLCDPKYNITIDQLCEQEPALTFVCIPTSNEDFTSTIDAVLKLIRQTKSGVILKSDLPMETLTALLETLHADAALGRFIYAPDLSSDTNTSHDYVNPDYIILGGLQESCEALMDFFAYNSYLTFPKDKGAVHICMPVEAQVVYQGIKAYLNTKTVFFAELSKVISGMELVGVNFPMTARAIVVDHRIGTTDWSGVGTQDTSALSDLVRQHSGHLPLLETVLKLNAKGDE